MTQIDNDASAPVRAVAKPPETVTEPVKVGIIGLGRWARVLTHAAKLSGEIEIVAGFSRSLEKRSAFASETGISVVSDLPSLLSDPDIKGVILTVPNEQHLPVALESGHLAGVAVDVFSSEPPAADNRCSTYPMRPQAVRS